MEDMINDVVEVTTDVAEDVVDEVVTTTPVVTSAKSGRFGAGLITGIIASAATWGIKKLWDRRQAKKALKPVEEPVDTEDEVVEKENIKEV